MAKNRARHLGRKLELNVSGVNGSGAGNLCKSGDPGVVGVLPFVVLTDEDANGLASVDTMGVYYLDVAADAAGGGVAQGDEVTWNNTTGLLGDAAGGVAFGVALEAVAAGDTERIEVRVGRV